MVKLLVCSAIAACATATASAQVNLVNNGSFEADGMVSAAIVLTGWTVLAGNVDTRNSLIGGSVATDGTYLLDLEGTQAATITQTIGGLSVGQPYRFSFDLGANTSNTTLGLVLSGATALDESLPALADPLVPVERSFTAATTTLTITFIDRGGTGLNAGPALDAVSLVDLDCNNNGALDADDIKAGTSLDCFDYDAPQTPGGPYIAGGANGIPDECECMADWDRNGTPNSTDVSQHINSYFADLNNGTTHADVDCNGTTNSTDVSNFVNIYFFQQNGQLPFSGCTL